MSKLSGHDKDIRKMRVRGLTLQEIGDRYGVSRQAIFHRINDSYKPKLAHERKSIQKYLRSSLCPAGKTIIKFCIERNLKLGQAEKLLGMCRGVITLVITGRTKMKRVYLPYNIYLEQLIAGKE